MPNSGVFQFNCTALEPVHHGDRVAGNVMGIRTQTVNGVPVPYVSGNSLKHRVREAAARYAVEVGKISVTDKRHVDTLYSGGRNTRGGSGVDLELIRSVTEHLPALSLCGYSSRNHLEPSRIALSNAHVVCKENEYRMPAWVNSGADLSPAHQLIDVVQMTRHDQSHSRHRGVRDDESCNQMIYEMFVTKAATRWWFDLHYDQVTDHELAALLSAFSTMAEPGSGMKSLVWVFGGKSSAGFGKVRCEPTWYEQVSPGQYRQREMEYDLSVYDAHLKTCRASEVLDEVSA